MKKTVIGLTLFSVVQKRSGKYVIHEKEYCDYIKDLFSEERLKMKSDIFFNISLPQLASMDRSGCDYRHYVVYSDLLPEKYKNLMTLAESEFDFLKTICVEDYSDFNVREELEGYVGLGEVFAFFGLDDDDLVASDYLKKIKCYVEDSFVGFNVVMSKGFSGIYDGKLSNCREVRFPFINIGQARICKRNSDGRIFIPEKGGHMKTDEHCPTVIDSRSPNFFWFRHAVQDSFSNREKNSAFVKIKKDLDNYPEPSESVLTKFPALSGFIKKEEKLAVASGFDINLDKYKEKCAIFDSLSDLGVTGNFELQYSLRNVSGFSRRQAVAVFELSRSLSESELHASGLQVSKVGYYRYFNTGGENESGTFSIFLPSGCSLINITAMRWGADRVLLNHVVINYKGD